MHTQKKSLCLRQWLPHHYDIPLSFRQQCDVQLCSYSIPESMHLVTRIRRMSSKFLLLMNISLSKVKFLISFLFSQRGSQQHASQSMCLSFATHFFRFLILQDTASLFQGHTFVYSYNCISSFYFFTYSFLSIH